MLAACWNGLDWNDLKWLETPEQARMSSSSSVCASHLMSCRLWELLTLPPVVPLEERRVVLYLSRSHGGASNGGRQVWLGGSW